MALMLVIHPPILDGMMHLDALDQTVPADQDVTSSDDSFAIRARLARIMQGADFPALSRQVIDTITTIDDDANSLQQLASIVLREYGLTLSVVRTANSAHYRRGGRGTESATQAMMMLGARVVRKLAASMMLFETFQRRSPELRELMLLSLLTANHARACALKMGLDDPESAHLCGMFRNLGEVLIAGYFHDDYRRIRSLVDEDGRTETAALRMVLGFQYNSFGREVASEWGLPESIEQGMRATATTSSSVLASVTAFSHELTSALYQQPDEKQVATALGELLKAHRGRIPLTRDQVAGVARDALLESRAVFLASDSPQSRTRLQELATSARAVFGAGLALPDDEAMGLAPINDATLRTSLRKAVEDLIESTPTASIGAVLTQALEAILRGAPFDRVVVCFFSADRQQLIARTGLGQNVDALLAKFSFPVTARGGPVVTLTQQRQPAYVPTDRALTPSEQRWGTEYGIDQFGVFPLVVLGKVIGCIYCDRRANKSAPDRATVRYTKMIADLVVEAIARRRS